MNYSCMYALVQQAKVITPRCITVMYTVERDIEANLTSAYVRT